MIVWVKFVGTEYQIWKTEPKMNMRRSMQWTGAGMGYEIAETIFEKWTSGAR